MQFIKARPEHDGIVSQHYMAIWESYGTPPDHLRPDHEAVVRDFLEAGRRERALASFIAFEGEVAAASVSCQLHFLPYPAVVKSEHLLHGYIWSVYVDPRFRRRGFSRTLTGMAIDYLRQLGCTSVVLHASDAGQALYLGLGFEPAHEMRLKLRSL